MTSKDDFPLTFKSYFNIYFSSCNVLNICIKMIASLSLSSTLLQELIHVFLAAHKNIFNILTLILT